MKSHVPKQWWDQKRLADAVRPEYVHLSYLGNGQNGVVFMARRSSDKKFVAFNFVGFSRKDRNTRDGLTIEVKARKPRRGRRAIQILESNLLSDPPYYVMEFLPLGDLRRQVR